MKSIRRHLLFWLLAGAATLLLATGACAFFAVRYVLVDQVDTELQQARKMIYNLYERNALVAGVFEEGASLRPGRTPRLREDARWQEFDRSDGELLYQVRIPGEEILLRSPSLDLRTVERPDVIPDPRKSVTFRMSDGTRIRARIDYTDLARLPSRNENDGSVEIIVARDLAGVTETLSMFLAGILAVGAVEDIPVALDGEVVVRPRMRVTMSCDHRVIDGAQGSRFLASLKGMLEEPAAILL